jgi:hypothetical protein
MVLVGNSRRVLQFTTLFFILILFATLQVWFQLELQMAPGFNFIHETYNP